MTSAAGCCALPATKRCTETAQNNPNNLLDGNCLGLLSHTPYGCLFLGSFLRNLAPKKPSAVGRPQPTPLKPLEPVTGNISVHGITVSPATTSNGTEAPTAPEIKSLSVFRSAENDCDPLRMK